MNTASPNQHILKAGIAIALIAAGAAVWIWAPHTSGEAMWAVFEQDWNTALVQEHNRSGLPPVRDASELTHDEFLMAGWRYMDTIVAEREQRLVTLERAVIVQVGGASLCLIGSIVGLAALRRGTTQAHRRASRAATLSPYIARTAPTPASPSRDLVA